MNRASLETDKTKKEKREGFVIQLESIYLLFEIEDDYFLHTYPLSCSLPLVPLAILLLLLVPFLLFTSKVGGDDLPDVPRHQRRLLQLLETQRVDPVG